MARHFSEPTLVIASHNAGKVREISELLSSFGVEVVSAGELGLPEPIEDGETFVANARIKSEAAAKAGFPALADDSGLCVDALGGEPGIYSARWARVDGKDTADFDHAMRAIEDALQKASATAPERRGAHFVCALSLTWPDGHTETFEGRVDGHMVWPPRGKRGFGYDPVFQADGETLTFGEMDPARKHSLSHRADAFQKLVAACFKK